LNVVEVIQKRRSVRKYLDKPVEEEKINIVLEAARLGPSAANIQPCHFIVVTDPVVRASLREAYGAEWLQQAPVVIVVCANTKDAWKRRDGENYWIVDGAIAMQNVVLAATELRLGTCWIAALDEGKLRKALNIPKDFKVIAMTPVGYPAEEKPAAPDRKPLESMLHKEKW
jgi:nitroreductase